MYTNTTMETKLSERGQIALPAAIRKKYDLRTGQRIQWQDFGGIILLSPVPKDPIRAFRGQSKHMRAFLLKAREQERKRERA